MREKSYTDPIAAPIRLYWLFGSDDRVREAKKWQRQHKFLQYLKEFNCFRFLLRSFIVVSEFIMDSDKVNLPLSNMMTNLDVLPSTKVSRYYSFTSPSKQGAEMFNSICRPVDLANLGSTCWFNVAVQLLYNIPPIRFENVKSQNCLLWLITCISFV